MKLALFLGLATVAADDSFGGDDSFDLGACTSDNVQPRLQEAANVCCDEKSESCKGGWPNTCNLGCGALLVPLKTQCEGAMTKMGLGGEVPKLEAATKLCPCQAELTTCAQDDVCMMEIVTLQRLDMNQYKEYFENDDGSDGTEQMTALRNCYVKAYNVTLDPDDGLGPGWDDGIDDQTSCTANKDCPNNMYCDGSGNCYDCSFIDSQDTCDSMDGDCCSAGFLAQCSENPAQCPAPLEGCTTPAAYTSAVADVTKACCGEDGSGCEDGIPTGCNTECRDLLDRTMRGCSDQIKAGSSDTKTKLDTISDSCANIGDDGFDGGDGYGSGDDLNTCDGTHASCAENSYCDGNNNCYDCSFISFDNCDAMDEDCCSAAFLKNCPNNPAQCQPKITCTTSTEYTTQFGKLTTACCPTPDACPSGQPSNCTDSCFKEVDILFESCATQLESKPQATQDAISDFRLTCMQQKEENMNNEIDGGYGYGGGGDMPTCDGTTGSCSTGSYCDQNQNCYDCSFISPDNCDENSGDCCSDDFLKNCPSNPFQCQPRIACSTPAEYSQELAKLTSLCCPTAAACPNGQPSNCTLGCFHAVSTITESCKDQLSQQPQATQDSILNFKSDCIEQDQERRDRADGFLDGGDGYGGDGYGDSNDFGGGGQCTQDSDCDTGSYCDQSGTCYECGFISLDDCDDIEGSCCTASFLKQCPSNPMQCPPPISCTTATEYSAAMNKLTKLCCSTPGSCVDGVPESCSADCSVQVRTVVQNCQTMIDAQTDKVQTSIANFNDQCVSDDLTRQTGSFGEDGGTLSDGTDGMDSGMDDGGN